MKEDVEAFIRHRVSEWRWGANLTAQVTEALLAKSEGTCTFHWVSLAIGNVRCSGHDFNKILDGLPEELEKVYGKMLATISAQKESRVLNMVRSVALALRPLTFAELGYIMA